MSSVYSRVASFGGVYFEMGDVVETRFPSSLKTNMGKTFIEKDIPMRNAIDIVLDINGVITGLSRTSAQTLATAIENDRASLTVLEDGYKHLYSDGRNNDLQMVIISGSLVFDDTADRIQGQPYTFKMQLKEWK